MEVPKIGAKYFPQSDHERQNVPDAMSVVHVKEVPVCCPRFSRAVAPGWLPGIENSQRFRVHQGPSSYCDDPWSARLLFQENAQITVLDV